MATHKINVIGFYRDGQDGSGTFNVYRDKNHYVDERLAEEEYWYSKSPHLKKTQEEIEAQWDVAEAGDSPYEDGELANATIEVEVDDKGHVTLAKSFSLHWGQ